MYSVLALLSFAVGAALVRSLVPPAEGGQLAIKLEYFAAHKDEYDAVYIGSSRVHHGLDPVLVDGELARAGVELCSFNLGVAAMSTFEQDFLLHRVLDLQPERLRWIFLEGGPVGVALPRHHAFLEDPALFSARGVQWHTSLETRKVLACLRPLPLPPWRKLELALAHLELFGRNLTGLGRADAILERVFEPASERKRLLEELHSLASRRAGFQGLDESDRRPGGEPEDPALGGNPYLSQSRRVAAENALPVVLSELDVEFYREQLRAAAERGIELVYFTPPGGEGSPEALRLHELGILPVLHHFNDPERYPELFQEEQRIDLGHLNRSGAERFSRLFAEAVRADLCAGPEELVARVRSAFPRTSPAAALARREHAGR